MNTLTSIINEELLKDTESISEMTAEEKEDMLQFIIKLSKSQGSDSLYKIMMDDKKEILKENKIRFTNYNRIINKQWKKAFDILEMLILVSFESISYFFDSFNLQAKDEKNILFFALRNIHSKALLVSNEYLTLIRNGYPEGALSRWRTLHELSIIGSFLLKERDNDLCERYLMFSVVQTYKEEEMLREKGHPKHTNKAFFQLKDKYESLMIQYGANYVKGDYGWANDKFGVKAVTSFTQIEEKVNGGLLRGYSKASSNYIHGNNKSSVSSAGVPPMKNGIHLSGPSYYGLSIPIQSVGISLFSVTRIYATPDTMMYASAIEGFLKKLLLLADKIETKIEQIEMSNDKTAKVLLTCFKGEMNSSKILTDKIRKVKYMDKLYLTNSFGSSEKELLKQLDKADYDYIISFGKKPDVSEVIIEISAKRDEKVLSTTFSYTDLVNYLIEQKVSSKSSNNSGDYLCNNIYYKALEVIKDRKLSTKCLFIHIPKLDISFNFDELAVILTNYISEKL
ncbi:MAG: DUF5677 domain-containing protein [Bacilli bacterium]